MPAVLARQHVICLPDGYMAEQDAPPPPTIALLAHEQRTNIKYASEMANHPC